MHDLAIIIVSTNEAKWLRRCLQTLLDHLGPVTAEVVVVDNESTDGTRELVEAEFPGVRVVRSRNRGFSHANNRGLMTCEARHVLFLNPDTEIVEGTFAELVALMDARQSLGLIGVKQVTSDGLPFPTIRRFPNALRALGEAFASERLPFRVPWLGERELDLSLLDREVECDWTSGSFMLARREALESAGFLDERFFIFAEETDLCLRIKRAGWEIRHVPLMTIVHHFDKVGVSPKMEAQNAFAKMQYARKNFSAAHRAAYATALALRYIIRLLAPHPGVTPQHRIAARRALRTMLADQDAPFGAPPPTALALRAGGAAEPSAVADPESKASPRPH
jgi:N-acetylglucosaminyl-diphospho-decaprenol L-rhamnosyltransferase